MKNFHHTERGVFCFIYLQCLQYFFTRLSLVSLLFLVAPLVAADADSNNTEPGLLGTELKLSDSVMSDIAPGEDQDARVHRVKPGETLWDIAELYFDNPDDWPFLQQINTIEDPGMLQPGTLVDIDIQDAFPLSVLYLNGDAWRVVDGRREPLEQGIIVDEGDVVETGRGASLTLEMSDGARAVIPSNSLVMVSRDGERGIRLILEQGEVESQVPSRQNSQRPYTIQTTSGVLGVRGTRFAVSHGDEAMVSSVYEGKVAARSQQAARRAQLNAGQGTRISDQGDIEVVGLLMPPELLDARSLAVGDLVVSVESVPQASRYRAQLARDATALDVIAEQRSTSPEFTFPSLPFEDYYLRVAAVDELGIVGEYSQDLIQHFSNGVSVERLDDAWRFDWQRQENTPSRLELSFDPSFDRPLVSYPPVTTGEILLRNVPEGDVFWRVVSLDDEDNVTHVIDSGALDATE